MKNNIMQATQILQSTFLEILFDGKNKLYGAYDLRKTYNRRISTALVSMIVLVLLLLIVSAVVNHYSKDETIIPAVSTERTLQKIAEEEQKAMPKLPAVTHTAALKVTAPRIVEDPLVLDPPPDVKQIENARIDDHAVEGPKDFGIIDPPEDVIGTNVPLAPSTRKNAEDSIFLKVEIEASFPGGAENWRQYVKNAILAKAEDFTDADYGTCLVRFIVDKSGGISNVQAITMRGTKLAEIAVNAIRKGPKWIPAQQNGQIVNAYRVQPIILQSGD
jgi:protein TonB